MTKQRIVILDAVYEAEKHTTRGEIDARARAVDTSMDHSTLYRTLKLFIELGLVVSAQTGDDETYYEITKAHPHHHLVCRACGAEQEIDQTVIQGMFDQVYEQVGFKVESDPLVLFGTCRSCQAADKV